MTESDAMHETIELIRSGADDAKARRALWLVLGGTITEEPVSAQSGETSEVWEHKWLNPITFGLDNANPALEWISRNINKIDPSISWDGNWFLEWGMEFGRPESDFHKSPARAIWMAVIESMIDAE